VVDERRRWLPLATEVNACHLEECYRSVGFQLSRGLDTGFGGSHGCELQMLYCGLQNRRLQGFERALWRYLERSLRSKIRQSIKLPTIHRRSVFGRMIKRAGHKPDEELKAETAYGSSSAMYVRLFDIARACRKHDMSTALSSKHPAKG
jgi:hypothetical protein